MSNLEFFRYEVMVRSVLSCTPNAKRRGFHSAGVRGTCDATAESLSLSKHLLLLLSGVSGFGLRVSGSGVMFSGFGFRSSGFGFGVSCFGFRVPDFE